MGFRCFVRGWGRGFDEGLGPEPRGADREGLWAECPRGSRACGGILPRSWAWHSPTSVISRHQACSSGSPLTTSSLW